ncbi:MAG: hypothetical protein H0V17_26595 [Deltaproteobacteria bacterium]|nr:hypothetical protein [Deltaproteobacteria bacterium]
MKRFVAMYLLVAACGGDPDPIAPDGPAPVQPGGPVTIAITVAGQPRANVEVMFQNADSVVVAQTVTDAEGSASGNVEAGGYVTVIEPRPQAGSRDRLSTFAGVQPGDALRLELDPPAPVVQPETFLLKINLDPDGAGHIVETSCGRADSPGVVDPEEVTLFGCQGTADILVVSVDDTGEIFHSHFHRAQDLDPNTPVDLSSGVYAAFEPSTVTFDALPADTSFVGVYRAIKTTRGVVFDVSGGATASSRTATINLPTEFDQRDVLLTSSTPFPPPGAFGQHTLIEWDPIVSTDYTLRVADNQVLPFTSQPTYDPASRTASWTEGALGQAPNYVQVSLNIFRDDIPEGRGWDWRMVAPRDGTSYVFPTLPPDASDFELNVIDGDVSTVTGLTTAKLPAGYDDKVVRERAFGDVKAQIEGESGQLVIQTLADLEPTEPGL